MSSVVNMGESETFSKIVKSLLLDVDIFLDQLVQIGYFNKEQRDFLDKYVYKSEEALLAGNIAVQLGGDEGPHSAGSAATLDECSACGSTPTLSKSYPVGGVDKIPAHAGHLRAIPGIIDEQTVLNNFLSRCNARNFSVQVNRPGVTNEIAPKGKAPEYVNVLEPIAETGTKLENSSMVDAEEKDGLLVHEVNHDTEMMLGIKSFSNKASTEAVGYDSTAEVDSSMNIQYTEPTSTDIQLPDVETTKDESSNLGDNDIGSVVADSDRVEALETIFPDFDKSRAGIQILGPIATPPTIDAAQSGNNVDVDGQENGDDMKKPQVVLVPVPSRRKAVRTNGWGKAIKSSPRNVEGHVIGESAEPLGPGNKGHAMLQKMGWSSGTGLGKQKNGILEPISQVMKNRKSGLGSSVENPPKLPVNEENCENTVPCADAEAAAIEWKESEIAREEFERSSVVPVAPLRLRKSPDEQRVYDETFRGIRALLLREGQGESVRSIEFVGSKINAKKEFKTTKHYPGVVLRALTVQAVDSPMRSDMMRVSRGDHLEILRRHRGNEYHVYNFSKKVRGVVRILQVEMYEEPKDTERNTSWE